MHLKRSDTKSYYLMKIYTVLIWLRQIDLSPDYAAGVPVSLVVENERQALASVTTAGPGHSLSS